ncbi:MAG: glutamate-1-semialdehyde 2,1-aminomutase [Candidatus Desulfofervidaceae bacterium]|nr:glutamate-1-semialdehyde 2,1-aminomutase [Candidatus Desulfofervidaceae bacterium]
MSKSQILWQRAQTFLPGGVNSPVRAWRSVKGKPVFIERAQGAKIYDADGREYIDYVCSWGPMIVGHAHPEVVEAIKKAAEKGTSFGAPTEVEVELAELVTQAFPSIEKVRMVNSGTEATMSAVRLARAYTGRDKVIKFDGCYHGHADSFLVKAGSGLATLGIPASPGVPADLTKHTISLPYNDFKAVEETFAKMGNEIACVIVEPVAGNMGVVLPEERFLAGLREITQKNGSLLIFDEVITGFRVSWGGAQAFYGIDPDLTCLGKIIGGGLPVGAYGGKKEIMSLIAPEGQVYQAGTLSGNPLAMAAGLATLKILQRPGMYEELEQKAKQLTEGIKQAAQEAGLNIQLNRIASMFSLFFEPKEPVRDYESVLKTNAEMFIQYFYGMLNRGIYLAPSAYEAAFVSLAHTEADIENTIQAVKETFKEIKG